MSIVFVSSSLHPSRPFTMITNTGVKSMIFFSMSIMSSWSFAPMMNSSSVNSPVGSRVMLWDFTSVDRAGLISMFQSILELAGGCVGAVLIALLLAVCCPLPSPFTSILSNMSETISSGSMSLFRVMSWMACGGRCTQWHLNLWD